MIGHFVTSFLFGSQRYSDASLSADMMSPYTSARMNRRTHLEHQGPLPDAVLLDGYNVMDGTSGSGNLTPKISATKSLSRRPNPASPPEMRAICPWVKSSVWMGSRAGIPDESTGLDTVRLFMSITSFRRHPRDIQSISNSFDRGAGYASLRCHDVRSVLYAFFPITAHAPPGRLRLRINRNNLSPDTRCR